MRNDTTYRISLQPRTPVTASDSAKAILQAAKDQLGFIPNMYANMANSPELLETYTHGYQLFRQNARFTPVEQEVIFLTISVENDCRYCVAAHSTLADGMSKVSPAVTAAIRRGSVIPDAKLHALSTFTQTMVRTRGNPSTDAVHDFLRAGYQEVHILDLIQAIAVKLASNYSNHVFHTALDAAFAGRAWALTLHTRAVAR